MLFPSLVEEVANKLQINQVTAAVREKKISQTHRVLRKLTGGLFDLIPSTNMYILLSWRCGQEIPEISRDFRGIIYGVDDRVTLLTLRSLSIN